MPTRPTDAELANALRAALAIDPRAQCYPTIRAARHVVARALAMPTLADSERMAALEALELCGPDERAALRPLVEAKPSLTEGVA